MPVLIPKTALQTINDQTVDRQTVVFVQTNDGFQPQPVTIGRSDDTHVEIRSGLVAGQRYVKKGGFAFKAELGKESFGDEHHH